MSKKMPKTFHITKEGPVKRIEKEREGGGDKRNR